MCKDLTFERHVALFFNIIPLSVCTFLPVMLKGFNATFKSPSFDCPESPPMHIWRHHMTESGYQKWHFSSLGINASLMESDGARSCE